MTPPQQGPLTPSLGTWGSLLTISYPQIIPKLSMLTESLVRNFAHLNVYLQQNCAQEAHPEISSNPCH